MFLFWFLCVGFIFFPGMVSKANHFLRAGVGTPLLGGFGRDQKQTQDPFVGVVFLGSDRHQPHRFCFAISPHDLVPEIRILHLFTRIWSGVTALPMGCEK